MTSWSATENVVWKTRVAGKGHSSPIVTDTKVFLSTADQAAGTQSVCAFDRSTGQQLWQTVVNASGLPKAKEIHVNNTHASGTIAVGDDMIYVVFFNHNQKRLTALDFDGEIKWRKIVGNYASPYAFGTGASPIVYRSLVIVSNENVSDGQMIAFDRQTGDKVWNVARPSINYSTPVVANVSGKDQLLLSGLERVVSYDPNTGKENWSTKAAWQATCGTMVWNDELVFASGGYPAPQTLAIVADGSGRVLWSKPLKCYEQSMIVVDDHLYFITDRGVIYCVEPRTGKVMWKNRFKGPVSASPVAANGNIYFTAENGQTLVIKASPQRYQPVAANQLGNRAFASFGLSENRIYTRVGDARGGYQEWLYCIGKP